LTDSFTNYFKEYFKKNNQAHPISHVSVIDFCNMCSYVLI